MEIIERMTQIPNTILFGAEGRLRVKKGIDATANAVKVTLGAKGRNAMLIKRSGPSHITKDGVTVARDIFLEDPFEKAGSDMVKEVAFRTLMDAGDGTTTASILFQALVEYATPLLDEKGVNVNSINKGILDGIKYAVQYIKDKSKPLSGSLDVLKRIAIIASNNDIDLGTIIASAVHQAGENGNVSVIESSNSETSYRMVNGMQYDRGYLQHEFVTHPRKNLCILEDAYVLISERPLLQLKQVAKAIDLVAESNERNKQNRPLLFIAPEVDMEALATISFNHQKKVIQMCAVQCPGQGMSMEDYTNDLATYIGATVVSEERNIPLDKITLSDLGTAARIEVGPKNTLIIGGGGDAEAVETRIESLKALVEGTNDPNEKKELNDRISSISCGVAILSVGAGSVTEIKEKIDRVDDAIKACKAAKEEGFVAGSGATLIGACYEIPVKDHIVKAIFHKKLGNINDYQKGLYCVYMALQQVNKQITVNAGKPPYGDIFAPQRFYEEYGFGYDAREDEMCNLFERGIIDPAKVLRVALQNAGSVATTFLTTEVFSFVN